MEPKSKTTCVCTFLRFYCEEPLNQVNFAVHIARDVHRDPDFDLWAEAWLSGADRSASSIKRLISHVSELVEAGGEEFKHKGILSMIDVPEDSFMCASAALHAASHYLMSMPVHVALWVVATTSHAEATIPGYSFMAHAEKTAERRFSVREDF